MGGSHPPWTRWLHWIWTADQRSGSLRPKTFVFPCVCFPPAGWGTNDWQLHIRHKGLSTLNFWAERGEPGPAHYSRKPTLTWYLYCSLTFTVPYKHQDGGALRPKPDARFPLHKRYCPAAAGGHGIHQPCWQSGEARMTLLLPWHTSSPLSLNAKVGRGTVCF